MLCPLRQIAQPIHAGLGVAKRRGFEVANDRGSIATPFGDVVESPVDLTRVELFPHAEASARTGREERPRPFSSSSGRR